MLKRFLKNRRGTAEIIGSALFIVIILFFFSNVYLWHDQATREMNNVLLERMNASVSMVATDEGVNVTNNGGVTFALSRLWIIDQCRNTTTPTLKTFQAIGFRSSPDNQSR